MTFQISQRSYRTAKTNCTKSARSLSLSLCLCLKHTHTHTHKHEHTRRSFLWLHTWSCLSFFVRAAASSPTVTALTPNVSDYNKRFSFYFLLFYFSNNHSSSLTFHLSRLSLSLSTPALFPSPFSLLSFFFVFNFSCQF